MSEATAARDAALAQVSENSGPEWREQFDAAIRYLPPGFQATGEELREYAAKMGVPPAHHPNAYGARIMALIRWGVLERTGRFRHMRQTQSHGRMTPVYERT